MLKSLWPAHVADMPMLPQTWPILPKRGLSANVPYVTVNVAEGVNVWLRFLSTTFIFSVY